MTMTELEAEARRYSEARQALAALVGALEDDIAELKRRHLPAIRQALGHAADAESALRTAVAAAPELFSRPRTRVLHGIRVGWTKSKGQLVIADPQRVVQLILRHLPEQAEVLIKTTRTPVKKALAQLSARDLKRLGVQVAGGDDQVVVRPVDGEVERMVDALLAGAADDAEDAA